MQIDFINIVHQVLTNPTLGTPMQKFNTFANSFQALAKTWNNSVFGNLFHQQKVLHTKLQCVQTDYSLTQNSALLQEEQELSLKLHDLSIAEETFWLQRARTNWLRLGDRNTSYIFPDSSFNSTQKETYS